MSNPFAKDVDTTKATKGTNPFAKPIAPSNAVANGASGYSMKSGNTYESNSGSGSGSGGTEAYDTSPRAAEDHSSTGASSLLNGSSVGGGLSSDSISSRNNSSGAYSGGGENGDSHNPGFGRESGGLRGQGDNKDGGGKSNSSTSSTSEHSSGQSKRNPFARRDEAVPLSNGPAAESSSTAAHSSPSRDVSDSRPPSSRADGSRSGGGGAASDQEELTIDELRALAENPNFNLTAVLQNPRAPLARSLWDEIVDALDPASFDPLKLLKDDFDTELMAGAVLPLPPVPLPPVGLDDFSGYLKKHGQLADRYAHNHRQAASEQASVAEKAVQQLSGGRGAGAKKHATAKAGAGLGAERDGGGGKGGKGGRGSGAQGRTPAQVFAEVPALFQKAHFTLAEPAVFEQVVLLAPPERQEQLTAYLDLVEVCLLQQISSRQESFFEALSNLQALRSDVGDSCRAVATLRAKSADLQRNMVSGTLRVPQLARRQNNLAALRAHLGRVEELHEQYGAVQDLFEAADFVSALGLIKRAQRTIAKTLPGVKCLMGVAKQLAEYEVSAAKFLATQFVQVAVNPDEEPGGADENDNNGDELSSAAAAAYDHVTAGGPTGDAPTPGGALAVDSAAAESAASATTAVSSSPAYFLPRGHRRRVARLVRALVRIGELPAALEKHRRRLEDSVKLIVRVAVEEYVYDSGGLNELASGLNSSGSAGAAAAGAGGAASGGAVDGKLGPRLGALDAGSFKACLASAFESVLDALQQAAAVHAVLEATLRESESSKEVNISPGAAAAPAEASALVPSGATTAGTLGEAVAASSDRAAHEASLTESESQPKTNGSSNDNGGEGGEDEEDDEEWHIAESMLQFHEVPKEGEAGCASELVAESLKGLRDACELAQKTVSALLVNRKLQHQHLSVAELQDLQTAVFAFVARVEASSGRSCYGLRSTLLAQAKAMLEHRQEQHLTELAASLDGEKWVQAEVSAERQAAVDRLASGQATALPGGGANSGAGTAGGSSSGAGGAVAASKKTSRAGVESEAVVDGARFKVVWSCLFLVDTVNSLLSMAAHFPMLATDVLSKVVELLRLFNSRATQLVLLAGAMHSAARLPKITGKHLALSAQCLGLLLSLLPHVRAALALQLPPRQHLLLVELDRVQQDLREHHERILAKFVSIVGEIVDSLSRSLPTTDWDRTMPLSADNTSGGAGGAGGGEGAAAAAASAAAGTAGASQFVADTIKNAQTMHKVLSANLPPEQVQEIFSRIFELLNRKLPLYFETVSPATPAGQQRLVDDIQHLTHSLERLRGINAAVLNLEPHFRQRFPNAR